MFTESKSSSYLCFLLRCSLVLLRRLMSSGCFRWTAVVRLGLDFQTFTASLSPCRLGWDRLLRITSSARRVELRHWRSGTSRWEVLLCSTVFYSVVYCDLLCSVLLWRPETLCCRLYVVVYMLPDLWTILYCVFQVARSLGILDEVNRMKVVPGVSPSSSLTNKNVRYMEVNTTSAQSGYKNRIQVCSGSSLDLVPALIRIQVGSGKVCLPAHWSLWSISCVCTCKHQSLISETWICYLLYSNRKDSVAAKLLIQVQSDSVRNSVSQNSKMLPPSKRFKMENSIPVHQNGIETPRTGTSTTSVLHLYYTTHYYIITTHWWISTVVDVTVDIHFELNWHDVSLSSLFSFQGGTPVTSVTPVTSSLKPCLVSVSPLVIPAGFKLLTTTDDSASRWAGPAPCPLNV